MVCEQAGEHGQRGAGVPRCRPYPFPASWLTVRVLLAVPPYPASGLRRGERGGDGPQRGLVERLLHAPSEQPLGHALAVELEQVGQPAGQTERVAGQALVAVEQVLKHVVGRVTHVRLGIDDEPRLTL